MMCFCCCCSQVVETVRVFVTDTNDEPPEFQNLPFIIDIPEVQYITQRQLI